MRIPTVAMAAGSLALLAAAASPLLPVQAQTSGHHNNCERKFDAAQRQNMESFRDYDREAFVDVHHPDAVSVFAAGVVAVGRDEIMEALDGYFRDKVAEMELDRGDPRGARLQDGVIVYQTLIERPGLTRHALNTVTYSYEHGRWLVVSDQGTAIEPPETDG